MTPMEEYFVAVILMCMGINVTHHICGGCTGSDWRKLGFIQRLKKVAIQDGIVAVLMFGMFFLTRKWWT